MNYPDGMTRSDWIAVGEIDPDFIGETRVLRAVVYLTYSNAGAVDEDDTIESVQSPFQAEKDIERVLRRGLECQPDDITVVDAEYMTEAEAGS